MVQAAYGMAPKQACDYKDPLCSLKARFMFGSVAIGDRAYYSGGLDANDPTYPLSGSYLEAFDTNTLSPYILQTNPNAALNTSRYRQQMALWGDDKVVMVGGQFDDKNGASEKTMTMIILDLVTRQWKLRREFWQSNQAELIWNWAGVDGNTLYMVVEDFGGIDPDTGTNRDLQYMGRNLYAFNLTETRKGKDMIGSFPVLGGGIFFLQLPVVTAGPLAPGGGLLVWQSARNVPSSDAMADPKQGLPAVLPAIVVPDGPMIPGVLAPIKTALKQLPSAAATGGKILKAFFSPTRQQLFLWTRSGATFQGQKARAVVQALSQYGVEVVLPTKEEEPVLVQLTLSRVFVAVPPRHTLPQLQSVDVPVAGEVAAAPGRVVEMPFVGEVDIIGDLDSSNVDILETPSGLFVRGSSRPDDGCLKTSAKERATWSPFVISISLPADGPPVLKALGANTWCVSADAVKWVEEIQNANYKTKGFRGIHGADKAPGGRQLLMVSPGSKSTFEIFAEYDTEAPLMGALVDVSSKTITQFQAKAGKDYKYPRYVAACVTKLPGSSQDVYVEYGGAQSLGVPKMPVLADVSVMAVPSKTGAAAAIAPAGAAGLQKRAQAAMACAPDGRAWVFGGLRDTGADPNATIWEATADLGSISLSGGAAGGAVSAAAAAAPRAAGAAWPPARHGASMVFLPASVTGQPKGSLLLFGGSKGTDPELQTDYAKSLTSSPLMGDSWLYDLSTGTWSRLPTSGEAPPAMMWHAMAPGAGGAVLYGGVTFDEAADAFGRDNNLYVLGFPGGAVGAAEWRRAPVSGQKRGTALKTEFINAGVVPLGGLLALQREKALDITSMPTSADLSGPGAKAASVSGSKAAAEFAALTSTLTSGDLITLSPPGGVLELDQPLVVAGDFVISGSAGSAAGGKTVTGRRLAGVGSPGGATVIKCSKSNSKGNALVIMSAGVVLRDLTITGCKGAAILLKADPSQEATGGKYPEDKPVELHNVTLSGNPGGAISMDNGTAAALSGCLVSGNGGGAAGGAVAAGAGTVLLLADTELVDNAASAVKFSGVSFSAKNCLFQGNTAADGAGLFSSFLAPNPALYAGAAEGTEIPTLGRLSIDACRFSGNAAARAGGGLFVGPRMTAFVTSSGFVGNSAGEGGGAHADRDGCLELMSATTFSGNQAETYGGGLLSRAPLCENSSMVWDGLTVANNTAGGDGGGAYVSEVASRRLRIARGVFDGNAALGVAPAGRSGDGGALYLGTWSSEVALDGTKLSGNRAARSGGAVHAIMLSQDTATDLLLAGCELAGNAAAASDGEGGQDGTEGGALRVLGSFATVNISGSKFDRNSAGQGGAVSFGADRGNVSVGGGTVFSLNEAVVAGGGLLAGESVNVALDGASFLNNSASGGAGAGGGLACYRCNTALVRGCRFDGNRASGYGGGAAVLQPHGGALLQNSVFSDNAASAPAAPVTEARRHRHLMQAAPAAAAKAAPAKAAPSAPKPNATRPAAAAAAAKVTPMAPYMPASPAAAYFPSQACSGTGECVNAGFRLGAWATTVDVGNTTSDDGLYGGGGGLYLAIAGPVNMSGCSFTGNQGQNGGGMIARTDLCPSSPAAAAAACKLWLLGRNNSFVDNKAAGGAGGGLLFTKIGSGLVQVPDCGGRITEASFADCLGQGGASSSARRRRLMAAPPSAGSIRVEPLNSISGFGYGEDVASAATSAHFVRLGDADYPQAPKSADYVITPSGEVPVRLQLRDELQRDVQGNISDASMIMQAVLLYADGTPADNVVRVGNISRAVGGAVDFSALRVRALPGTYILQFVPMDPNNRVLQAANLTLSVGQCTPGFAMTGAGGAGQDAQNITEANCQKCQFGSYSLDPNVGYCVQCDAKSNANCTGVAVIPSNGFWQSHPRSPLVHRCLVDQACNKAPVDAAGMYSWASLHRNLSVADMNAPLATGGPPLFQEYVDMQCSTGYQGILCGECADGWGRRGHRCVACEGKTALSRLFYAMAVFYLVALVALAGFMHARQVEKKQRSVDAQVQASFLASVGTASAAASDGVALGAAEGRVGSGAEAGAPGTGGWKAPAAERVPSSDTSAPDQRQRTPFEAAAGGRAESLSTLREDLPVSPEDFAVKTGRAGSAAVSEPSRRGSSWLNSLFSAQAMREARPTLHAPGVNGAAAVVAKVPERRFWVSSVIKLLITHLQILGLLRGLRINWSEQVSKALVFFDQTSTVSAWVSLDCSLADNGDNPGAVRRSIKRTLVMLFLPIIGALVGLLYWGVHALVVRTILSRRWTVRRLTWRNHYRGRVILTVVLIMFYLYPQVSNAVISIFSCTVLDSGLPLQRFKDASLNGNRELANLYGALAANATHGYWDQDTHYQCMQGHHQWLFALGMVWAVAFCAGFPVAMVVALWRHRGELEDKEIDLRYGFFYDSYDTKYFYWESIILVEKLLLVCAITLLQRYNATAQVLAALVIVSMATVLQITFRPSGCNMLHTLQRASWYVLQCTLFLLMMANLEEITTKEVISASLTIALILNVGLIIMFIYAFWVEVRRLLLVTIGKAEEDDLKWDDVVAFIKGALLGACGGAGARERRGPADAPAAPAPAADGAQRQASAAPGADQV